MELQSVSWLGGICFSPGYFLYQGVGKEDHRLAYLSVEKMEAHTNRKLSASAVFWSPVG